MAVVFAPTAAAANANVVVTAGTPKGLFLVPAAGQQLPPNAEAAIFYMSGTDPVFIGVLRAEGRIIASGGTFNVSKLPGVSFGVNSEG